MRCPPCAIDEVRPRPRGQSAAFETVRAGSPHGLSLWRRSACADGGAGGSVSSPVQPQRSPPLDGLGLQPSAAGWGTRPGVDRLGSTARCMPSEASLKVPGFLRSPVARGAVPSAVCRRAKRKRRRDSWTAEAVGLRPPHALGESACVAVRWQRRKLPAIEIRRLRIGRASMGEGPPGRSAADPLECGDASRKGRTRRALVYRRIPRLPSLII